VGPLLLMSSLLVGPLLLTGSLLGGSPLMGAPLGSRPGTPPQDCAGDF